MSVVSRPLDRLRLYGTHLLLYVVERVGRVDGKANQDNVGVGV